MTWKVPIIGYRAWVWDWSSPQFGSFNGELWYPGKPMTAICKLRALTPRAFFMAARQPQLREALEHQAPHPSCTCGIYAFKAEEEIKYRRRFYGAVYLWGTVVEHRRGWRAEFAYPKSFVVPPYTFPGWEMTGTRMGGFYDPSVLDPFGLHARWGSGTPSRLISKEEIESQLRPLTAYGADILLGKNDLNTDTDTFPLWTARSGYDQEGLDLMWRCLHTPSWQQLESLASPA
jgi:hypothetical protein